MKLTLFKDKDLIEEKVEVHYREEHEWVSKIIATVNGVTHTPIYQGKNHEGARIVFDPCDVCYFESVDKKTFAYLQKEVLQIEESLSQVEDIYRNFGFVRINKSCIVNLYKIKKIKPELNMRIKIELETGESLIINRGYKKAFDAFLEERI